MNSGFAALKRFTQSAGAAGDRCELCSRPLGSRHPHLLEPGRRKMLCACQPCSLLFADRRDGKYLRVPLDVRYLDGFQLTDAAWESLRIPIGLAFFVRNSVTGTVAAMYPSPAGATESLLELATWEDLVRDNPVLATMQSDVEGLLVNRMSADRGGGSPEYYLLPIDHCFHLVGLIRSKWRGLGGGSEVWQQLGQFFRTLRETAGVGDTIHA